MLYRASQHIGDGFDAAMRVPGETVDVIGWIFVPKVIKQQKRVQLTWIVKTKSAMQFYTGTLQRGTGGAGF